MFLGFDLLIFILSIMTGANYIPHTIVISDYHHD